MERRTLYFNEDLHKYTDEFDGDYISTTTLIGKYTPKFDTKSVAKACERIGRNPNHSDYSKYAGKSAWQIEKEWKQTADIACANGTAKHAIAEDSINEGTLFVPNKGTTTRKLLYTVNNLIDNPNTGLLDFDVFAKTPIAHEFPLLYTMVKAYAEYGYRIYSELGVYHSELNVSGLIDAPLFKGNDFIILDWKTNKDDIRYESGYFKKDAQGNTTDVWVSKDETFKYPLHDIPNSIGHKYAMQLSIYAWLLEQWGFRCDRLLIGHIRKELYGINDKVSPELYGKNKIEILPIQYMKREVELLMEHHRLDKIVKTPQVSLF
jgi:hypothetical protein